MTKIALITGGVRRLGRQISYFLADEGFHLAIIYNTSSKSEISKTTKVLKSKQIKFKFYKCDLRNIDEIKKTIEIIGTDFKKFDLLINNAGIIKKINFLDIYQKIYDDILNVNLRSVLFVTQFSLKYLQKANNPHIINIASLGAIKNWVNYIPYCISKAGVIKLTYLLAKNFAPKIRVNAIAPGILHIEGELSETKANINAKQIPLKRLGNTIDIIEALKFLISCEYITGQIINVDGGCSLN